MAIRLATTVPRMAISSDTGRRAQISVVTGLADHIEVPKLKVMNPHMNSKNWMMIGRFRPSSS